MSSHAPLAIAFIVREKFGWALASLERVYRHADVPFRLYFVDCGYPKPVLSEIDRFLADKGNVVRIASRRFLLPNETFNLLLPNVREPVLSIVQNDVLVEPGFFAHQLDTFARHGCAIVQPHIDEIDGESGAVRPHRDEFTDTIIVDHGDHLLVQVPVREGLRSSAPVRPVSHFEFHTLSFATDAARAMAPRPVINSREHVDLAVHAFRCGLTAYIDERAKASYVLPPIHDYDVAYFRFRWDVARAEKSHRTVMERWRIANMPTAMGFVLEHRRFLDPARVRATPQDAGNWSETDVNVTAR